MKKTFTLTDQMAFAECSGDFNPIHIEEEVARRSMFGHVIVHGMNLFLWALDGAIGDLKFKSLLVAKVTFVRPAAINQEVEASWSQDGDALSITVSTDIGEVLSATIVTNDVEVGEGEISNQPNEIKRQCEELDSRGIENLGQTDMELFLDTVSVSDLFPNLAALFSPSQLASFMSMTRLVGMHCPGLNSVFSGFDVHLPASPQPTEGASYKVSKFDERFGFVKINFCSLTLEGEVSAFLRPPIANQEDYRQIKPLVRDGEFKGCRALIIGGSRGLGEVAAKILAAGGGEVRITYNSGANDAHRVVDEISKSGGNCNSYQLDVLELEDASAASFLEGEWAPTHLFYFATPPIFQGMRSGFSMNLLRKFMRFYVDGFINLLVILREANSDGLTVLYPSTVFVETAPLEMKEYAFAKSVGESACETAGNLFGDCEFFIPRLPMLETDQTATVMPVERNKTTPVILENIREMFSNA